MRRARLANMCMVAMLFMGFLAPMAMADEDSPANATVSFGQWQTDPPLDRFPPSPSNDRLRNEHRLIPHTVNIKAGGAVNFIISGFHQPIVYDDGIRPGDIKTEVGVNTTTTTGPTPSPAVVLIDDPKHRIYRGTDPSLQPLERASSLKPTPEFLQDRVEVVLFPNPGTYLVICGVHGHFVNDDMFGFVKVEEEADD
jgi:plastocyanin